MCKNILLMYPDLYHLMKEALKEAEKGLTKGEVPVGAVLADSDGRIVAKDHNQPIALNDPTAHAEILALRKAGLVLRNYRLNNTILVVTVEPCLMCMAGYPGWPLVRMIPKEGPRVPSTILHPTIDSITG
jgi:tRNA(Arg) A34 adenosine deaminase TadA